MWGGRAEGDGEGGGSVFRSGARCLPTAARENSSERVPLDSPMQVKPQPMAARAPSITGKRPIESCRMAAGTFASVFTTPARGHRSAVAVRVKDADGLTSRTRWRLLAWAMASRPSAEGQEIWGATRQGDRAEAKPAEARHGEGRSGERQGARSEEKHGEE